MLFVLSLNGVNRCCVTEVMKTGAGMDQFAGSSSKSEKTGKYVKNYIMFLFTRIQIRGMPSRPKQYNTRLALEEINVQR